MPRRPVPALEEGQNKRAGMTSRETDPSSRTRESARMDRSRIELSS
jgi:hypothetical protein